MPQNLRSCGCLQDWTKAGLIDKIAKSYHAMRSVDLRRDQSAFVEGAVLLALDCLLIGHYDEDFGDQVDRARRMAVTV
jgi:hypothetical protein